ncbi:hypothetical protein MOQ_003521 [Trypanosoma cruzi marinkellei]|uniref:PH domain-containing protein n=1 Tax=Trypanosoma cruzi marinkellei TaxID=85056 RepID=K2NUK1_TRYCR|nr:hypothetical protein MOQ_003521 [Trypanosoma cruzi marinkellei]
MIWAAMSFSLPQPSVLVVSEPKTGIVVPEKQKPRKKEKEDTFTKQKKELEDIIERQKRRIQELYSNLTVDAECHERLCRAQLLSEKENLETALAGFTGTLDKLSARRQELLQVGDHAFQWGEMRSKCVEARSRISDLKDEIEESEKQVETVQTLVKNQQERLNTVRRELRHVQQQVKWMLECQAVDEQAFKNRIREEEDYLRQLMEARDGMEKESSQLTEMEKLELSPLQDEVNTLEAYLKGIQGYTQTLQVECYELQKEMERAKMITIESSENELASLEYQRALEKVDQQMVHFLNEKMEKARRQGITPLLVHSNKKKWLQNYRIVWERLSQHCSGLRREKEKDTEKILSEVKQGIEKAQRELNEITGSRDEGKRERQTAFLFVEHLVSLVNHGRKTESQLLKRINDSAVSVGEMPEAYTSLAKMSGYNDFMDDEEEETVMPMESTEQLFKPIEEESPELAIGEMRSTSDFSPDDRKMEDIFRKTAHRSRGHLQEFLQQKCLFMSEHAAQAHIPLRRTLTRSSPSTVEASLSLFFDKMIVESINYAKSHQQKLLQDKMELRHGVVQADLQYAIEANELQTRVHRIFSERQSSLLTSSPGATTPLKGNHPTRTSFFSKTTQRIVIEGARLPPDVVRASSALQARYFLSCAIRGFTAVMLTPGSVIPTVRHIFLTRDLDSLCARDVSTAETGRLKQVDFAAKLKDVHDIHLVTDEKLTSSKLRAELSFTIVLSTESEQRASWVVQADNPESRTFWAYVFAWVVNESSPSNEDAIIVRLKSANKIFVLDAADATADGFEPNNRCGLYVQVDEK